MWHPTKNEGWTPHTISVDSVVEVWWVCPAGHEWPEPVRGRTAPRKWKRGDITACGVCSGYHALQTCMCGRTRLVKAGPTSLDYECAACAGARIQERWRREKARTDYVAGYAASQALLDPIVPARLPPALVAEWRRTVGRRLRWAMEHEYGYGELGVVGAVDDALRRIQAEGDLLPTAGELRAAHAAGEPIRFMDRTFWTHGVLHVLGIDVPDQPRNRANVASLEQWLQAAITQVVKRRRSPKIRTTASFTGFLTELVQQWGESDETDPWRSFFELVPPFVPSTGRLCGFIDVVLTRADTTDLVVEIDSAHRLRSMEKLQFAHAAGATAVWIRWHQGAARTVPGVHVIDLISQTRSVQG